MVKVRVLDRSGENVMVEIETNKNSGRVRYTVRDNGLLARCIPFYDHSHGGGVFVFQIGSEAQRDFRQLLA